MIPENCFGKIPSAELRPNRYDPFDCSVVSPLVYGIVENRLSRSELIQKGFDQHMVRDIMRLLGKAKYKRRQAPLAIRITRKAFGLGWKMPIDNRFRE